MSKGMGQQKLAVETGYWPLFRYDPARIESGGNPLQLDSKPPSTALRDYMYNENRYRVLLQSSPETAERLLTAAQAHVTARWQHLADLAAIEPKAEK